MLPSNIASTIHGYSYPTVSYAVARATDDTAPAVISYAPDTHLHWNPSQRRPRSGVLDSTSTSSLHMKPGARAPSRWTCREQGATTVRDVALAST